MLREKNPSFGVVPGVARPGNEPFVPGRGAPSTASIGVVTVREAQQSGAQVASVGERARLSNKHGRPVPVRAGPRLQSGFVLGVL